MIQEINILTFFSNDYFQDIRKDTNELRKLLRSNKEHLVDLIDFLEENKQIIKRSIYEDQNL